MDWSTLSPNLQIKSRNSNRKGSIEGEHGGWHELTWSRKGKSRGFKWCSGMGEYLAPHC